MKLALYVEGKCRTLRQGELWPLISKRALAPYVVYVEKLRKILGLCVKETSGASNEQKVSRYMIKDKPSSLC